MAPEAALCSEICGGSTSCCGPAWDFQTFHWALCVNHSLHYKNITLYLLYYTIYYAIMLCWSWMLFPLLSKIEKDAVEDLTYSSCSLRVFSLQVSCHICCGDVSLKTSSCLINASIINWINWVFSSNSHGQVQRNSVHSWLSSHLVMALFCRSFTGCHIF